MKIFLRIFVFMVGLICVQASFGQKPEIQPVVPVEEYKEQAGEMVRFFAFMLNNLGSNDLTSKEKDVIIRESYLKIFASNHVQIEDDLDENRTVPLNKDVQAYLKDVLFFFRNVTFGFEIQKTEFYSNHAGPDYIIVTLTRTLTGETVDGQQLQNNLIRFVEINIDENKRELKIASIYTTKLDEKEERRYWWSSLSPEWRNYFGAEIRFGDTLQLSDIIFYDDFRMLTHIDYLGEMSIQGTRSAVIDSTFQYYTDTALVSAEILDNALARLLNKDDIDLTDNPDIIDIEPLSKFENLRKINLTNTGVWDLSPLRNLTKIEQLNLERTHILSVAPLKYLATIRELVLKGSKVTSLDTLSALQGIQMLDISETYISDISALSSMTDLRQLKFNKSHVKSLKPLKGLVNLQSIEFSGTSVGSLEPLSQANQLVSLKAENTPVSDLAPLAGLQNLEMLYLDKTQVKDLFPLGKIKSLKKVYCDQTQVSRESVNEFRKAHPDVLIIFESDELSQWWQELPEFWKNIFRGYVPEVTASPTKEQLHKITSIPEINLSEDKKVKNIKPLSVILGLRSINISKTQVADLLPLKALLDLEWVDCSGTPVSDISPLAGHNRLERLNIENTQVSQLMALKQIQSLRLIYADNSRITNEEAKAFSVENPGVTVIYRTETLWAWWANMGRDWNNIFIKNLDLNIDKPSSVHLHQMTDIQSLSIIQNAKIQNLEPLKIMTRIKSLSLNFTGVTDLSPVAGLITLEDLNFSDNPVKEINALQSLTNLVTLDLSNTRIRDIRPISMLKNLKTLNLSGTEVYTLKPVSELTNLEYIDFNNTAVSSLKPLDKHRNLKTVKCINTRISKRHAEDFRKNNHQIEVYYF